MSASALPGAAAAARFGPRAWGLILVLCGALFLDALDVSMVGVALPSISADLDMSTSSLQWVISGYVLGFGGFLLLGGRLADLLGRRRVFLIALGVFVVASALGGLLGLERERPGSQRTTALPLKSLVELEKKLGAMRAIERARRRIRRDGNLAGDGAPSYHGLARGRQYRRAIVIRDLGGVRCFCPR